MCKKKKEVNIRGGGEVWGNGGEICEEEEEENEEEKFGENGG